MRTKTSREDTDQLTVDPGSLRSKAVSSILWVTLDKWGSRFVSLVILVLLGRLLTPADFGLVALTTVFVSIATIFVDQGFSKALIQRKDLSNRDISTVFWIGMGIAGVITALVVALAGPIADVMGDERLAPVLQWLAISIVVYSLSSVPAALLERELKFKSLAMRRLLGTTVGGVAAVVVAVLGGGVWSLVVQTLATAGVGVVVLWAAAAWRPRWEFSKSSAASMWAVGRNVLGIELVGVVSSQADRLLIGAWLGPVALGYYFMAMRIVGILVELFSAVFSTISLATLSRLQDDRVRMRNWLYKLAGVSSVVAVPVFAVVGLAAPVVLPLVFGDQWSESSRLLTILSFLGALNAIAYFDRSALIASNHARAAFYLTLGQGVLGIVLVLSTVNFGITAVAIAVVARQYLYWPVRLVILNRYIGLSPLKYFLPWFYPFATCLAAAGVVCAASYLFGLYDLPVVYVLLCLSCVACAVLVVVKWLNPSTLESLKSVVKERRAK